MCFNIGEFFTPVPTIRGKANSDSGPINRLAETVYVENKNVIRTNTRASCQIIVEQLWSAEKSERNSNKS